MDDQYGLTDLRHYMASRPHFPAGDPFMAPPNQHYDIATVITNTAADLASPPPPLGLSTYNEFISTCEGTTNNGDGGARGGSVQAVGDGGSGARWPRQETLTLLEVRTRLDCKFKEANQKGPLWDEVSRIMSEEHGYQRSGKKCREKFENLYKYYKKTKEGKAGRQDGKHYRFFRQLEALYGDNNNNYSATASRETDQMGYNFGLQYTGNSYTQAIQGHFQGPKLSDSLSLHNSSEFDTSSSDDNVVDGVGSMDTGSTSKKKKRRDRKSWKTKVKEFIDSQMKKVMDKQEEWLEKMIKTIERKEQERMLREEEWKKQEADRIESEHKFWANERAWIEARDAAFMEALNKIMGKGAELGGENGSETITNSWYGDSSSWGENEISKLIQLRSNLDFKFQGGVCSEEAIWEEISGKMSCLGYDRRGGLCKEKWESIKNYVKRTSEGYKRRKEDPRSCYFMDSGLGYNHGEGAYCEVSEQGGLTANINCDGGFRFMFGNDGGNVWDSYGVKLNKGAGNL